MYPEQSTFILADEALNTVVQQIADDQWDMKLPDWFQLGGTQDRSSLTLRQIINYHAFDEAWVPSEFAGETADSATGVPRSMDDDLLGDDPKASFSRLTQAGVTAVKAATDPLKIVHFSYGDFSTAEGLTHVTSFRAFRAYDIAKLIGADTKLPDELIQGMWDMFMPHLADWQAVGVFKASLPIPEGASLQDKLLLSVGRQP